MNLLTVLAAQVTGTAPASEQDPPAEVPTSAPYNALTACTVPTPDLSGSTIHPSAVDMGTRWNGYRYWMANTPYAGEDAKLENPCIWASNDGQVWEVPPGGSNPLYPTPEVGHWADTDILYDPDSDRLVLTFNDGGNTLYVVTSTDGVTWPLLSGAVVLDAVALAGTGMLSQSLVRVDAYLWRMYAAVGGGAGFVEASNPLGPWGNYTPCTGLFGWHHHVILDRDVGEWRAITSGGTTCRSPNGIAWQNVSNALPTRPGWETGGSLYRACMRPYDATTYHVWYSVMLDPDPFTGYTRVPKSMWSA